MSKNQKRKQDRHQETNALRQEERREKNIIDKQKPGLKKVWDPSSDQHCGVPWETKENYPGMYFFEATQEEVIDALVNKLGRNDPMMPSGGGENCGQPEYFASDGKPEITGLLLAPWSAATEDNQSTIEYTLEDRKHKIKKEGRARLEKGLSFIKNPPIVRVSPVSPTIGTESGNNRSASFWEEYGPTALQLFITSGDAQNVHPDASQDLAIRRARTAANPTENNRALTLKDHANNIKEEFERDPCFVETESGKKLNPDKTPLTKWTKDDPVFHKVFDYLCGAWVTSIGSRTKVLNIIQGRKNEREFDVENPQKFTDLLGNGWTAELVKDGNGTTKFEFVPWKENLDLGRNSVIICDRTFNNPSQRHDVIYQCIMDYREDKPFAEKLKNNNIQHFDIYAEVNAKTKELADRRREELLGTLRKTNRLICDLRKAGYPDMPLFKNVMFPRQWKSESLRIETL